MAGLLQQQAPQQPPQAPQGQPQGEAPQQGQQGGQEKMKAAYQKIVSMALDFLYSEPGVQSVMAAMKMPGTPAENIGTVVARMIQRMWISAKEQGKQIPPPIIFKATDTTFCFTIVIFFFYYGIAYIRSFLYPCSSL